MIKLIFINKPHLQTFEHIGRNFTRRMRMLDQKGKLFEECIRNECFFITKMADQWGEFVINMVAKFVIVGKFFQNLMRKKNDL